MRAAVPPGGAPLPHDVRSAMEAHFGADFRAVRIHLDAPAQAMSEARDANAYALGEHIVFGPGQYAPLSGHGQRTLAHELAHVVQQRRGGGPPTATSEQVLEAGADRAADTVAAGLGARATVAGATGAGVLCDRAGRREKRDRHDDDDHDTDEDSERARRQEDKRRTQEERLNRERAGKTHEDIGSKEAERELRKMEKHATQPGGNQRSGKRRERKLRKFERKLPAARGSQQDKNTRKGNFDERQRTPSGVAAQTDFVAGSQVLPGQQVRDGRDRPVASHTRPDFSAYRRRPDGTLERVHFNLKSHQIDRMTPGEARSAVREVLYQAVRNKKHLPGDERLIISFAHAPDKKVREAIKHELFRERTPISEIRFGNVVDRDADYKPVEGRQPLDTDEGARRRRLRAERKAAEKERKAAERAAKPKKKRQPGAPPKAPKATQRVPRPQAPTGSGKAKATVGSGGAPRPPQPSRTPKPLKVPRIERPVTPKSAARVRRVGGKGVGVLAALAVSFLVSEAQAAVSSNRGMSDRKVGEQAFDRFVESALAGSADQYMRHYLATPDAPLYANITMYSYSEEKFVVGGGTAPAVDESTSYGVSFESLHLSPIPRNGHWVEDFTSAREGGGEKYIYTVYATRLDPPSFEDKVLYAKQHGLGMAALRARMVAGRDAANMPDQYEKWSEAVDLIDSDDNGLLVKAATERLPADNAREYFAGKLELAKGRGADAVARAQAMLDLVDAPYEDLVDHVAAHGSQWQLTKLRYYAHNRALAAGRSGDAGAGAASAGYWSQMTRYIDSLQAGHG